MIKMYCELCGSKTEELLETNIEGAVLKVCKVCSKMGTLVYNRPGENKGVSLSPDYMHEYGLLNNKPTKESDLFKDLVDYVENYGRHVQEAREKLPMTHKELSKELGIKESLIHAIESERIQPTEEVANKLEKFLNIKIVEKSNVGSDSIPFVSKDKSNTMTVGDFLKVRKSK